MREWDYRRKWTVRGCLAIVKAQMLYVFSMGVFAHPSVFKPIENVCLICSVILIKMKPSEMMHVLLVFKVDIINHCSFMLRIIISFNKFYFVA